MRTASAEIQLQVGRPRRSPLQNPLHASVRTVCPGHSHSASALTNQYEDDADDEESPTKKTPKTKKSAKKAKDSEDEDAAMKEEPNEAGELMDDLAA